MHKLIRKYYLEIISVSLITIFWAGIWGYHNYQASANAAYLSSHSSPYSPGIDQ